MLSQKLRFRVETPLFCGGFDPSFSALRAASVKGVLRYWYRAIQPDLSQEKAVFGSTEIQSAVRLQTDVRRLKQGGYLAGFPRYFSFFLKGRKYIIPGQMFELNLLFLPGKMEYVRDVLTSLWLMTTIGGLGARCRRGFGSLSVQVLGEGKGDSLFRDVDSIPAWKAQVHEGLQQCWREYSPDRPFTHPVVHPSMKMFVYEKSFSRWEASLRIGAQALQGFRRQLKGGQRELQKWVGTADEPLRYPSATWLRVIRIRDQYVPVYFVLPNDLPSSTYQMFVARWGDWLINQRFEMSEFKR